MRPNPLETSDRRTLEQGAAVMEQEAVDMPRNDVPLKRERRPIPLSPSESDGTRQHQQTIAPRTNHIVHQLDYACTASAILAEDARVLAARLHDRSAVVLAFDADKLARTVHLLRELLEVA